MKNTQYTLEYAHAPHVLLILSYNLNPKPQTIGIAFIRAVMAVHRARKVARRREERHHQHAWNFVY